ncbi:sphingosine-1-phosphate phosphatase 2 [Exaiptasia diaphana]|uniref:Phosphatidic acid phosphatase type 2/haloperoxidase domain-containing protein n=1 Tax=Exaiptasia diaphana TaxID=2652724 RepID=A0A913XIA6_EXADI|nr:sphingosine-1-phosphate phosphatase 2 [Exaiptasia diaphana]
MADVDDQCSDEEVCEKVSDSDDDPDEYVFAPIDKLGVVGTWIRHRLLVSILMGTPPLVAIQRMRTPFGVKMMKLCSFFGTEEFYTPLVCFLTWVVDARLGRLLCFLMGIGFYVAGAMKNLLCLPRPSNPPIIPMEENSFETWGLPSHHAILAVLLPWYIWFYSMLHFNLPYWGFVILFVLIVLWSILVMMSRLYLGVHSPADIVVGGIIGCIILAIWLKTDDMFDLGLCYGSNVIAKSLIYSLLLLFIHPQPEAETNSYFETICMAGVTVGVAIGRATFTKHSTILKAVFESAQENTTWFTIAWVSLLKLTLGYILVILTRMVFKQIFMNLVGLALRVVDIEYFSSRKIENFYFHTDYSASFKLPPIEKQKKKKRLSKVRSRPENIRSKWNIEYPVRYLTYACMGWMCICGTPLLCQSLGLTVQ